jgi:uncharacterized membrane protein
MSGSIVVPCLLAFLIGIVAGMRAMTAPAAISWAARLGKLSLSGTWLAFLGYAWTPWILTLLAIGELVTDQLPSTPSRTVPVQFGTRILMGAVCGAALTAGAGSMLPGAIVGFAGAVAGTLGGRAFRARMAAAFGRDLPAALLEDAIAIGAAFAVVLASR